MALPSSKIDKLLQLLSSSEDELDGLNEGEQTCEEEFEDDPIGENYSQESCETSEWLENGLKKSENDASNEKLKVVELAVEPIVIIDSEVESPNCFDKDDDSDFNFKWSENEDVESKVKKTRKKRKRRKKSNDNNKGAEDSKCGTSEENTEVKVKRHVSKYAPRMAKNRPRVDRNLKCNECDKRMKNEQLFMLHMQIHNGGKETECVLCNRNFDNIDAVLEHYGSFDKDKRNEHYIKFRPFACHLCVVRYKNRRDLTDHLDIHAGQKKFLCPLCGKQFSKRFNMMTHMRKVHERYHHTCEPCNKRFRNIREYETHQRMVHGENKLACPICSKTFIRRDALKAHTDTHDNQCSFCNGHFNSRRDLNQHIRKTHISKFTCSLCGKDFILRYNYTKHLEKHNSTPAKPCNRIFLKKNAKNLKKALIDFMK